MRSFSIDVVADEEAKESFTNLRHNESGKYQAIISLPQCNKLAMPPHIVSMHEIGHILSREFNFPAHYNRFLPGAPYFVPNFTLSVEHEAWDVAEALVRMQDIRKFAIGEYEKYFASQTWFTYPGIAEAKK